MVASNRDLNRDFRVQIGIAVLKWLFTLIGVNFLKVGIEVPMLEKDADPNGITRFPAPAGGCRLTDPRYSVRLKELLGRVPEATRSDLELLKYGRHFRLPGGAKAVVGRTQQDNEAIETLVSPGDFLLKVVQYPGPLVLGRGVESEADLAAAVGLAAAYSDAPAGAPVTVNYQESPYGAGFFIENGSRCG